MRIVTREGEQWFFLVDVCKVLEIANSRDAASRLDDDEKDTVGITDSGNFKGLGTVGAMPTIISESGLYALIFTSRKPEAKRFRRWVTNEVLPAIRKSGRYAAAPDFGTGPSTTERQARLALDQITEIRMTFGVPAARAAWRRLGLVHVDEMTGTLSDTDRVLAAIREYGGMVTRTTLTGRVLRFMSVQTLDGVLSSLVEAGIVEVHRPARKGQGRRATFYRMAA
ncbi:BRO family protein [Segnochrobactraceae bacterium EtOH-i3]